MPVQEDDILKIRMKTIVDTVSCYNMFYARLSFVEPIDGVTEQGVGRAFADTIKTYLNPIHSTSTRIVEIYVENLTQATRPFGIHPCNFVGAATGQTAPSFVAVSFRQNVGTRATKNGYKRFSGITEDAISGQTFTNPSSPIWSNMATFLGGGDIALEADDPAGFTIAVRWLIVKKVDTPVYPPLIYQEVTSGQFMNRVTSQTSRKFFAEE